MIRQRSYRYGRRSESVRIRGMALLLYPLDYLGAGSLGERGEQAIEHEGDARLVESASGRRCRRRFASFAVFVLEPGEVED